MKKSGIGIIIEVEPKKKGKDMAKHKDGKRCDYPEHEKMEKAYKKHEKMEKEPKKTKMPKSGEKKKKFEGKMEKVMHEYKEGKLHSGSKKGPVVPSRKQAVAIALSEARKATSKKKKK